MKYINKINHWEFVKFLRQHYDVMIVYRLYNDFGIAYSLPSYGTAISFYDFECRITKNSTPLNNDKTLELLEADKSVNHAFRLFMISKFYNDKEYMSKFLETLEDELSEAKRIYLLDNDKQKLDDYCFDHSKKLDEYMSYFDSLRIQENKNQPGNN